MKNQVIEVLDKEHGRKVIEYWKSKGVDTGDVNGSCNKADNDRFRYYGLINNCFSEYSIEYCESFNAEIIELPKEKTYPRVMMVSFNEVVWYNRVVFMKKCGRYLAWTNAETIQESEYVYGIVPWRYAKELPEKVELTKSEIAEKFGVSVDQLVIKND